MLGRPWFRYLAGTLLAGLGAWSGGAAAQTAGTIVLTSPSTADFPRIVFYASVLDADRRPIHALPPTTFSLSEDGQPIDDFTMREEVVGSRQIFAVNTVTALRRRDVRGVTRFDQLRQALLDAWAARPTSPTPDQVSLLMTEATLGLNRASVAELIPALEDWVPAFSAPDAGYRVLLQALTAALDPLPRPGMETDVVFLTPLLDRNNEQPLADAVAMAATSGARLHAVLVGTVEQAGTAEALRLRGAAQATGGTFRVFDPALGLEDLEAVLLDVRTRYVVEYTSRVNASGPHTVQLSMTTSDLAAASEPVTYEVSLSAPQVAFISPPRGVTRRTDDPDTPLTDIPPTFLELPLLVTFPDGHPRPLEQLRLFVNGQPHETRTQPPFDRVRWDLSAIFEGGTYQLRAELTDSQGLTSSTEILSVVVEVIPGPRGLEALRPALPFLVLGLAIVAAGAGLVAVWIRLGEMPAEPAWSGAGAGGQRFLRRARLGTAAPSAEAFLVPLRADGTTGTPVPLDGAELTIGSDPALCQLLLDDPSVSGLHARLTRRAAGVFTLRDQHSDAGTWVNERPVEEPGVDLRHGDRIWFGRAAYRFRLATPPAEPRVVVRPASQESWA